jgi:hypothetical protein
VAFANISAVRTADPGNAGVAKDSFMSSDPFAIVLDIQVDSSVVTSGLLADVVWQIVNPRQDPNSHAWWTYDGGVISCPTVDVDWKGMAFNWGPVFWVFCSWSHYADAVSHIQGPDAREGVFYVQGTISIQGSSLFAKSDKFWFKIRP